MYSSYSSKSLYWASSSWDAQSSVKQKLNFYVSTFKNLQINNIILSPTFHWYFDMLTSTPPSESLEKAAGSVNLKSKQ